MTNAMKMYVIHWKSKASGRSGRGTKLLDKDEAERLVAELNREYPGIHHEAIAVESMMALAGLYYSNLWQNYWTRQRAA